MGRSLPAGSARPGCSGGPHDTVRHASTCRPDRSWPSPRWALPFSALRVAPLRPAERSAAWAMAAPLRLPPAFSEPNTANCAASSPDRRRNPRLAATLRHPRWQRLQPRHAARHRQQRRHRRRPHCDAPSRSRAVCDQSRPRRQARLVRETDGNGCRGVQSLVDAARGNGVQLPIGYRLQHAPNNRTVMRYAEGETYGAVERIETGAGYNGAHPDPHDCRRGAELGSGALCGMGIYPINTARYATGMPSSHRNFRAASWRRKRAASAGRRTTWTSLAPTSGTDCATVEL